MTAAPDLRSVIPAATPSYTSVGGYSYPAMCQPQSANGLVAPTPRGAWDLHHLGAVPPTTGASTGGCYTYMDPVYHMHDTAQGP